MTSICKLCDNPLTKKNQAVFECGHVFHLSCVFKNPYSTQCSHCSVGIDKQPDIGLDRAIATNAELMSNVSERRLRPNIENTFIRSVLQVITPLTPSPQTFVDHTKQNKKLSVLTTCGFGPEDAVQERVRFSDLVARYNSTDILNFGFTWDHMVALGILPKDLKHFTWTQQQHKLKLSATKMLQMRLTLTELADMHYTTHQLIELGFTWPVMASMGANVDTWKRFNFELDDIKRYWTPSLSQWVAAGFYDKERVQRAGWPMVDVIETLPPMSERCSGRVLRLAF